MVGLHGYHRLEAGISEKDAEFDELHETENLKQSKFFEYFPWVATVILSFFCIFQFVYLGDIHQGSAAIPDPQLGSFERGWTTDFGMTRTLPALVTS
jgi:hypothetical protein